MAVLAMMLLVFVIAFLASMLGSRADSATQAFYSAQSLAEAESAAELAMREIRLEKNGPLQSTSPFTRSFGSGTSGFDGGNTTGSDAASDPDDALNYNGSQEKFCNLNNAHPLLRINDFSSLGAFAGSAAVSLSLYIKQRRQGGVSDVDVSYSTDGGGSWTYLFTFQPTTGWQFLSPVALPVNWPTVNPANVSIKLEKVTSGGACNVDYIGVYNGSGGTPIDTNTEPWRSNSYVTLPKNFSGGQITQIVTEDESGKINLNTANQTTLQSLLTAYGIDSATASTVAASIIDYRNTNVFFKNVEELLKVSGMTSAIYNAEAADPESAFNNSNGYRKFYQDCTVASWINRYALRPAAQRAPVNINTASTEVLKAVFGPLVTTYLSAANRDQLIIDIRAQRAAATFPTTAPFSLMYTSYDVATNQFAAFIDARSYLSATEKLNIQENADPSSKNWASALPSGACLSTEFCHLSNVFMIQGKGQYPATGSFVERTIRVLFGDVTYSAPSVLGSLKIPVTSSETGYSGYWREQ